MQCGVYKFYRSNTEVFESITLYVRELLKSGFSCVIPFLAELVHKKYVYRLNALSAQRKELDARPSMDGNC